MYAGTIWQDSGRYDMEWEKVGRAVYASGESTTYYSTTDGRVQIESRKRAIPHAGRGGCWMHTTYFLIYEGTEKEYYSLRDAKEAAERLVIS